MWITPTSLTLPRFRVRLEPIGVQHAESLFTALDYEAVWRWRPDRRPTDAADVWGRIEAMLKEQAAGVRQSYVIVIAESSEIAGTTGYLNVSAPNRQLEIGATAIGVPWQRSFVNTECKLILLGHAFEALNCVRVEFRVDTRNERSMRAVERLGAVREGTLRKSRICWDGFIRDTACFSVIAEEWAAVKEGLVKKLMA